MNLNPIFRDLGADLFARAAEAFGVGASPLTYTTELCPIADKFNQFDLVKLLGGVLTKDVISLTDQARTTAYDNYNKPNGEMFRYGISDGKQCERREWFGIGDAQFDKLRPITSDKGFEFTRRFDVSKDTLALECTVEKTKLHCKANAYFSDTITYVAIESPASTREKLCIGKKCERATTSKKKVPSLLNKLLQMTNKA